MKSKKFDVLMIIFMAAMLLIMNELKILEESAKFFVIPLMVFYYLGKYSERNFREEE